MALGRHPDKVVVWRNNTGFAKLEGVKYGLCVGSADLIGILADGRFLALEIKTKAGRVSSEQSAFLALIKRMGGVAAVVRSVEEALEICQIGQ